MIYIILLRFDALHIFCNFIVMKVALNFVFSLGSLNFAKLIKGKGSGDRGRGGGGLLGAGRGGWCETGLT